MHVPSKSVVHVSYRFFDGRASHAVRWHAMRKRTTVFTDLDPDVSGHLDQVAASLGKSRAEIAKHAVSVYLAILGEVGRRVSAAYAEDPSCRPKSDAEYALHLGQTITDCKREWVSSAADAMTLPAGRES